MKLNPNFVIHDTGDETLLVPTAAAPFHGLIQGNATLSCILRCLQKETTEEEIVSTLAAQFSGNADDMRADVAKALAELRRIGAIEQ